MPAKSQNFHYSAQSWCNSQPKSHTGPVAVECVVSSNGEARRLDELSISQTERPSHPNKFMESTKESGSTDGANGGLISCPACSSDEKPNYYAVRTLVAVSGPQL